MAVATGITESRGGRSRPARRFPSTLLLIAGAVSLLGLVPLGYILVSVTTTGWSTLSALVFRARVGELLINTGLLVLVTVPACIVLGVASAWLVERTRLPAARIFAVLLAAPLAVPAFVSSYGWVSAVPGLNGLWATSRSCICRRPRP
jgi:iron(III) transport system permease protein